VPDRARAVGEEPSRCGASLPEPLRPPRGHRLAVELAATGVQIYARQATAGVAAWAFKAPETTLRGLAGGCTAEALGAEARVPNSATDCFLAAE
jgi:hypothetical protein